jgi:hypothetical protein
MPVVGPVGSGGDDFVVVGLALELPPPPVDDCWPPEPEDFCPPDCCEFELPGGGDGRLATLVTVTMVETMVVGIRPPMVLTMVVNSVVVTCRAAREREMSGVDRWRL